MYYFKKKELNKYTTPIKKTFTRSSHTGADKPKEKNCQQLN